MKRNYKTWLAVIQGKNQLLDWLQVKTISGQLPLLLPFFSTPG